MRVEDLLHFARKELLAAAVDDLLAPPGDLHVALLVDGAPEVAGAKPALGGERLGVRLRVVVVAQMHPRSARGDLADLAMGHVRAPLVDQPQLHLATTR